MTDNNNDEWVTAAEYLGRLNKLINDADDARSQGDLITWYRRLRTIYGSIHWKIKQEGHEKEEKELDDQFNRAKSYLVISTSDSTDKRLMNQMQQVGLNEVEIILDDVYIKLHDLMFEYEFILPKDKKQEHTEKFYT